MRNVTTTVALGLILCVAGSLRGEDKPASTPEEQAAIEQIRKLGGQVLEVAQNDHHLEVSYYTANTKVNDGALVPLKALLGRLVGVNARGTDITDAGLVHLKDAKGLVRLHLEKTKITDAGLAHLKGLDNLEYLNIYSTAVTDAGLKHLEGLKKLKKLYVWETKVTDDGVAALKKALPDLQVIRGQ